MESNKRGLARHRNFLDFSQKQLLDGTGPQDKLLVNLWQGRIQEMIS
jgi:hypothetical protein